MYTIALEPRPGVGAMKRDNWGEFSTLFDAVKYITEELLPWGYVDAYDIQIIDTNTDDIISFDELSQII